MKRKRIIYRSLAIVVAVLLLIVYYFYLGSTAPVGQQPLVRLDKRYVCRGPLHSKNYLTNTAKEKSASL